MMLTNHVVYGEVARELSAHDKLFQKFKSQNFLFRNKYKKGSIGSGKINLIEEKL